MVEVDLSGDPIVIGNNGAELIFLGTNSNMAQSHNGDLYVDEIFWIPNFQKLRKVASGMASQSHPRTTYFSTSSTLAHGAYPKFRRTMKDVKPDLPDGQATHALRHSFATHFMINGGSIITLQRILGHSRIEQTMVYGYFARSIYRMLFHSIRYVVVLTSRVSTVG